MICVSIQNKTLDQIYEILQDPYVEMAEIRLDLCNLSMEEVDELFSTSEKALIATCRGKYLPKEIDQLVTALEAGARYVDIDLDAPVQVSKQFQKLCKNSGVELIRSYHDFSATPDAEFLDTIAARALRYGADVVKIVTTATCPEDADRVLSLYERPFNNGEKLEAFRLVAFAMGADGSQSRVECVRKGAPFTYCALNPEEATAPGQLTSEQMHAEIYADNYGFFRSELPVPASKSFAQRAILCAALAEGTSKLRGYTPCDDSEAAVKFARQIGAKVSRRGDVLTIQGIGPINTPLNIPEVETGESGLLTRLSIPVMAAINGAPFQVKGKGTLLGRPLTSATDIMAAFGVMLSNAAQHEGKEVYVPVNVRGKLVPGTADVPGQGGSQLISGLLTALPLCDKPSKLYVGEPKSIPYMFITLDVLRKFGVSVKAELEGNAEMLEQQDWSYCTGISFSIRGGQHYKAADFKLEGDWSAAANFLVAGAIFGSAEVDGVESDSLQADISITDVLTLAGATVSYEEDVPVCGVKKSPLEPFNTDLNNCPDIFPIVAVLAAFCPGVSEIAGVGRLKRKESDRGRAILEMLSGLGVRAQIADDVLMVEGETWASRLLNGHMLSGGEFSSHHDHRMAMALAVASLGAASPVIIDDKLCVSKSFPEFFDIF